MLENGGPSVEPPPRKVMIQEVILMAIQRWTPLANLRKVEDDMFRMWPHYFRSFTTMPSSRHRNGGLPIDAFFTEDALVLRAAAPGFKAEDVDLTVTGNNLVLKGAKESIEKEYLVREGFSDSFHRAMTLPKGLQADKAEASFEDGMLTITIPKSEEVKAQVHKIEVKS